MILHRPNRRLGTLATAAVLGLPLAHAQVIAAEANAAPTGTGTVSGPGIDFGNAPMLRVEQTITVDTAPSSRAGPAANDGTSLLPWTRRGYVGLNLGTTRFRTACGSGNDPCHDSGLSGHLYTGGQWNAAAGIELGYTDTGSAARAGGHARARGVNLSLVLRAPMGPVSGFVKVGALYGWTHVSTGASSDVGAGKTSGWGGSCSIGVGYDFAPMSAVVLEWNRSQFRFPGGEGRGDVDSTRLGYLHRL